MPYQAVIIQQLRTFRFGIHFAVPLTVQRIRLKHLYVDLGAALGMALAFSMPAWSQNNRAPPRAATIMVQPPMSMAIPNATVVLITSDSARNPCGKQNKSTTQHVLLTLLLLCVIAMKEPTAAQATRNLIGNSNRVRVARHDSANKDNTVKIKELVDRQVQAWEKHDFGIAPLTGFLAGN
jgi:hypothetical protein